MWQSNTSIDFSPDDKADTNECVGFVESPDINAK